ncbi:disease resistance-like protein DSC1 [Mangifera indica]|uniref:disease resistance-like protein DSC1 n=1 Tax=Mangifera indica TaxID=29780 RepID=UPI001CF9BD9C|nr:disease resistance-like protein DSC1 [Mangifera indica]
MASSSLVLYDVFLSFRGEDTRDGFTSHLNSALCRRKIETFIDDELKRGDGISPSLFRAIEGSKISVVVLSKRYASSRWCLEELVKILDCKKMNGQIVIPVFYRVDPSDVRKQGGNFGDAFADHEVRYKDRPEMLQRWRNALTEVASLSGFDSNAIRPESKLIEKIIQDILKRLNDMSSTERKGLVGVEQSTRKIISLLSNGLNEVCTVGLWGMGGIGKTTIATAVFNEISREFEGSCFIHNVREESKKGGLCRLQKELLSTILEDESLNLGLTFSNERLRRKKVLIVFDDVTNLKQIKELIVDLDYLGFGSRIIITTRDKQVLRNCGLTDATIYEVKGLHSDESFQLFKQYAFRIDHPIGEDFKELSNRVISYTKGLPLALIVLGSFLLDREKHEWESALDKLRKCPHNDIQSVLKISYDGLDDEEKDLFLDIACFFKGWDENLVKEIFDANSISSQIGIRVLIDKALIIISNNIIRMHDLLQEMGREIVRQESVKRPGERSRLWHHNDVYYVLERNKGTDMIRGLRFNMSYIREIHLNPHAFSDMDNLRFLIAEGSDNNKVHGFEGLEFDFAELRCIYWDGYFCTSLPLKFYPENLVILNMRNNNLEQLWSGIKNLGNLNYIDLSYSEHLLKIPDLSQAPNLKSVILEGCTNLFEITPTVQNLNKLVKLNLRNCRSLISLPIGIQSDSLRDVILSGCSNLNTAPRISCNMERLCLDGTAITELSSSIECDSILVELNLRGCSSLESLPNNICKLKFLKYLYISGCLKLDRLPEDIGNLESLEVLEANGTAIRELPSSMVYLKNIRVLTFEGCKGLGFSGLLSSSLSGLQFLSSLNLNDCNITELPDNLGHLSSLRDLKLAGNNFSGVPTSIMNLFNLWHLDIKFCSRLQALPKLPCNMENLTAQGCKLLKALSGLSMQSQKYNCWMLSFINCFNLDWNAIRNILNDILFKMYEDRSLHSKFTKTSSNFIIHPEGYICFPGSEIPGLFDIQSSGSHIVLPQGLLNHKFLGFVFCAIVGIKGHTRYLSNYFQYHLYLKCRGVDRTVCKKNSSVIGLSSIKSDHVFMGYSCNLFGEFNGNMEAFFDFTCSLSVKKCGIRLFKDEPRSRENFELGKSTVMSKVLEQVVINNSVNSRNNNGGGVHTGGVAGGSILQQNHAGGDGVYRRGNTGTRKRVSASLIRNRRPAAVGGTGMMGKGGNGVGQGIGEVLPLIYPQPFTFYQRLVAPTGWMGSYGGFLGASSPPFSGFLSRCTLIVEEEAHSNKRLKSSNFCKGESSSRPPIIKTYRRKGKKGIFSPVVEKKITIVGDKHHKDKQGETLQDNSKEAQDKYNSTEADNTHPQQAASL